LLDTIKILLGITDTDSDALLNVLIANAQDFIVDYCNLSAYDTALDNIAVKMVIEQYNKRGAEGISSKSYSGISESYTNDYSPTIYTQLNKHRRIKTL
jgi:hypothetical protein